MREIQSAQTLQEVSVPSPPGGLGRLQRGGSARHRHNSSSSNNNGTLTTEEGQYLSKVQEYLCKLTYNHTGTQFFETRPGSSLLTLMETAR